MSSIDGTVFTGRRYNETGTDVFVMISVSVPDRPLPSQRHHGPTGRTP
ncbi:MULTISPECIES: hypothetical protein [unclassified Haladaptatus]|nr:MULTISPECIES: hypothetical protein [unclassified Haladaptatus]MCO8242898.1 hypothetical protein [Haladaptatus sp. AB643]MCO8252655.1 hypothetical protein [Haladaptatus sp. AB618]